MSGVRREPRSGGRFRLGAHQALEIDERNGGPFDQDHPGERERVEAPGVSRIGTARGRGSAVTLSTQNPSRLPSGLGLPDAVGVLDS